MFILTIHFSIRQNVRNHTDFLRIQRIPNQSQKQSELTMTCLRPNPSCVHSRRVIVVNVFSQMNNASRRRRFSRAARRSLYVDRLKRTVARASRGNGSVNRSRRSDRLFLSLRLVVKPCPATCSVPTGLVQACPQEPATGCLGHKSPPALPRPLLRAAGSNRRAS